MIVVDTSAWIEWIRNSSHPVVARLEHLLEGRGDLAITEVVLMEVLAGAPSGEALARVRSQLIALPILRLEGVADFEQAARVYRACRDAGRTVRNQLDCLIAIPTIRHGASLLQNDRDFETIARHSTLKLEPLDRPSHGPREPGMQERAGRWRTTAPRQRPPRRRKALSH